MSSATLFVPLDLDLIEEGEFVQNADEAFRELQERMITYVRKHGKELSKGTKGKLTLAVTVQFEGRDANDFSIKGEIKSALPNRPAVVSAAMAGQTQDDKDALFVRRSGSTAQPPRQGAICTRKGETIDTKTGEVKPG